MPAFLVSTSTSLLNLDPVVDCRSTRQRCWSSINSGVNMSWREPTVVSRQQLQPGHYELKTPAPGFLSSSHFDMANMRETIHAKGPAIGENAWYKSLRPTTRPARHYEGALQVSDHPRRAPLVLSDLRHMPTYSPSDFPIEYLEQLHFISYTVVASIMFMVYDYMLTLGAEVELVWASKFTTIKFLFFLTRYSPILDMTLLFTSTLPLSLSSRTCFWLHTPAIYLLVIGMAIAEYILAFRTWLVWGRNLWLGIVLFGGWTLVSVSCMVYLGFFSSSVKYISAPLYGAQGCPIVAADRMPVIMYAELLVYEIALLILMIVKGVPQLRAPYRMFFARGTDGISSGAIAEVLYRDGIVFYIILCCLSAANLAVTNSAPAQLNSSLAAWVVSRALGSTEVKSMFRVQRVMHSSLSARMILHLREAAKRDMNPSGIELENISSCQFAHPSSGA
ncbi:hypothetical protein NM688_g296 [Phlebia brevispora]|uniref:Uncharacterized protein n=1 Tax=Phlebia brevispora TaxID=194682 RepID=A0ACC1TF11_9APHY|nr:hypothetical protein NM688_g296 [Phlebia brevispora]